MFNVNVKVEGLERVQNELAELAECPTFRAFRKVGFHGPIPLGI